MVARQAHNLEVVRSSRASATKRKDVKSFLFLFSTNVGLQTIMRILHFLGQSENSVAILLSGYSFVSLRHETMASITDSIS